MHVMQQSHSNSLLSETVTHFSTLFNPYYDPGVSTMANRDVPPLQYERVARLITDFPHLEFEINGAINTPQHVKMHLANTPKLKGMIRNARNIMICTLGGVFAF